MILGMHKTTNSNLDYLNTSKYYLNILSIIENTSKYNHDFPSKIKYFLVCFETRARWFETCTSRVSSLPRPSYPTARARARLIASAHAHSLPIPPSTHYSEPHISHSTYTRQNAAFQPTPAPLGSPRVDLRVKRARTHLESKHIPRPCVHICTHILHASIQLRHHLAMQPNNLCRGDKARCGRISDGKAELATAVGLGWM